MAKIPSTYSAFTSPLVQDLVYQQYAMYACALVSSVQCMMRQFFQFAARYHLISFILEEDPIPKMPSNLCFGGINVGEYPGNAVQKFCDI